MKVRDVLLVLLARGETHGYQLKNDFERVVDTTINIGQIYQTLERLERDKLIVKVPNAATDRRVGYAITVEGLADAHASLNDPDPITDTTRSDTALRVLLAIELLGVGEATAVIDQHRHALLRVLQQARAQSRGKDIALVDRLGIEADLTEIEGVLRWLDICDDELKGPH